MNKKCQKKVKNSKAAEWKFEKRGRKILRTVHYGDEMRLIGNMANNVETCVIWVSSRLIGRRGLIVQFPLHYFSVEDNS